MSRSESKKEKLRCFTSCLSKNDCLRRRSITTSAATQGSRGLRSDLTLDADTLSRSNVSESAKMAQTRDWIERISTVSLEIPVRASSSSLSKNPNFSSEWSNSCEDSGKKIDDCSCCARDSLQGSQDLVNGSSIGGEGSSSFSPSLAKRGHNKKLAHLPAPHLIAPHPSLATTGVDTSNILSCYEECCLNRVTPSNTEVPGCYADIHLSDAIDYIGAMYVSKNRETGSQCRRRRNPRSSDSIASIQSSLTNLNMSSPYGGSNSTIGGSSSYISLPTELVTVDLSGIKSLGITVVGHLNSRGDCGIYVGCIKKGGLAELSGRIKPGYLIMEVNDIDLEDMSNDTALARFRTELQKGGEVRILFGKFWDMSESRLELTTGSTSDQDPLTTTLCLPPGHRNSVVISRCDNDRATLKRNPSTRSLATSCQGHCQGQDPGQGRRRYLEASGMSTSQWLETSPILYQTPDYYGKTDSLMTSFPVMQSFGVGSSSGLTPSYRPDSGYIDRFAGFPVTVPDNGSIIDRQLRSAAGQWALPPTMSFGSQPFLGCDLVDWIQTELPGISSRMDAWNYAANLLQTGYIRGIDNKSDSEFRVQNCYVFGTLA